MRRRLLVTGLAVTTVVAAQLGTAVTATGATAAATSPSKTTATSPGKNTVVKGKTRQLSAAKVTRFAAGKTGAVGKPATHEIRDDPLEGSSPPSATIARGAGRHRPTHDISLSTHRPMPRGLLQAATSLRAPKGIVRTGPQLLKSFDGLNHRDQRLADNGNQYTLEPPDQGLCVGKGYVVEAVNDAVRIDTTAGKRGGIMSLNKFFGLPSAIDRTTGVVGPETTDPSCVYDSSTGTFYLDMLALSFDETGNVVTDNAIYLAVTQNPLSTWRIYRMSVNDDGKNGEPVHAGCPCIGDYPHIGFDANGFYVTTNEYKGDLRLNSFNAAQVYAFNKQALVSGRGTIFVTQFDTTGADQGRPGFTVWPAQSPSARDFNYSRGGTEYFLSSNAAEEARGGVYVTSRQIVIWTLTGTSTLGSRRPAAVLHVAQIGVKPYAIPPAAPQKSGPAPLLECLNDTTCRTSFLGAPPGPPETLAKLDSNDTRMQQVTYAHGLLYGALDTAVQLGSQTQAGIAWYVVRPGGRTVLTGSIVNQGQFGVPDHAVTYPAVGVNSAGKGVMAFTLTGAAFYPSAAYAGISAAGVGAIHVAAFGQGPEDGFTGYQTYNPGTKNSRWGDYGAASVAGNDIWIGSEYIGQSCTLAQYEATAGSCGGTRTALANWGTRISLVRP